MGGVTVRPIRLHWGIDPWMPAFAGMTDRGIYRATQPATPSFMSSCLCANQKARKFPQRHEEEARYLKLLVIRAGNPAARNAAWASAMLYCPK
jgi:hypothetical protein